MAKVMTIGLILAGESRTGIGHIACTLGGINYESRGSRGCVRGSRARGASHPLFRHHFHLVLSDAQAARAKRYADGCVGQPYVWAGVPSHGAGGDCSGFMSGILCAALGRDRQRLFATSNFRAVARGLGFRSGLRGAVRVRPAAALRGIGVLDRPFPGFPVARNSRKKDHVKWIQARLNFAARGKHAVLGGKPLALDGDFGKDTEKVLKAFQRKHALQGLGMCGPKTWRLLNRVR